MGIGYDEDGSSYLDGFPEFCPVCMQDALKLRSMPDTTIGERHWYCRHCGTEWAVGDLIEALEEEVE